MTTFIPGSRATAASGGPTSEAILLPRFRIRSDVSTASPLSVPADHGRDRQIGEDRGAEIAVQNAPDPASELDQERTVETQTLANALHILRARLVARDHHGGITRRDVEQAEHEQRDDCHHRQGRDDATEDVREHLASAYHHADFDTFQKNGSGPLVMPETFLRQAV